MKKILKESRPKASYRKRFIFDTYHSIERMAQRYGKGFEQDIIEVIEKAIDQIFYTYDDERTQYVIHSKSTGIGLAIDWRPDKYVNDNTNHCFIITVFDKALKHYKKNPSDVMIITEVKKIFEKRVGKKNLKESNQKGTYYRVKDPETGIDVHLYEGRVYDISAIVIQVE
jgi:uncharacterized protein (UPF0248 family)